jgi:hypothetical protein
MLRADAKEQACGLWGSPACAPGVHCLPPTLRLQLCMMGFPGAGNGGVDTH